MFGRVHCPSDSQEVRNSAYQTAAQIHFVWNANNKSMLCRCHIGSVRDELLISVELNWRSLPQPCRGSPVNSHIYPIVSISTSDNRLWTKPSQHPHAALRSLLLFFCILWVSQEYNLLPHVRHVQPCMQWIVRLLTGSHKGDNSRIWSDENTWTPCSSITHSYWCVMHFSINCVSSCE